MNRITKNTFIEILQNKKAIGQLKVLVDQNTFFYCLPVLKEIAQIELTEDDIICIESGEDHKTISEVYQIYSRLLDDKCGKNTLLVNLGGGIITDLGGFVASTYKRGILCMNVPTTLLGMIDASIGGKNGINFSGEKNMVGVIAEPNYTFIDESFLKTLPNEEIIYGIAEAFKHALICDKEYWNLIKENPTSNLSGLIEKSIEIKLQIVQQDPFEKNIRKKLNFGHTVAHALESYFLNNITENDDSIEIPHGLAVAHGIIVESKISEIQGLISSSEFIEIKNIMNTHFELINFKTSQLKDIIDYMKNDKKNINSQINFTLLTSIGNSMIDNLVPEEVILAALKEISNE